MTENKQKLIDLITAIGRDDIINFFYTFIATDLYNAHCIPISQYDVTAAFVEEWQEKQNRKEQEQKAKAEYKDSMKKLINEVDSKEELSHLKSTLENALQEIRGRDEA